MAPSGRMSCGSPNMQQLPRGEHRRWVVAGSGQVLVKADYSQIELRIAAKMSGSTQEEYAQMMIKGGRPIEGNRSKSEWKRRG